MDKRENEEKKSGRKILFALILTVFLILGSFVFFIAARISHEMSQSAIGNLIRSCWQRNFPLLRIRKNLFSPTIEMILW